MYICTISQTGSSPLFLFFLPALKNPQQLAKPKLGVKSLHMDLLDVNTQTTETIQLTSFGR
jgi:hypothetical protein